MFPPLMDKCKANTNRKLNFIVVFLLTNKPPVFSRRLIPIYFFITRILRITLIQNGECFLRVISVISIIRVDQVTSQLTLPSFSSFTAIPSAVSWLRILSEVA